MLLLIASHTYFVLLFVVYLRYDFLLVISVVLLLFFFFKQKTAYEMRISDWSSDVCSSDLCATSGSRSTGCSHCFRPIRPRCSVSRAARSTKARPPISSHSTPVRPGRSPPRR